MKLLTSTQIKLLIKAKRYTSENCPIKYDTLKSLVNIKSFDSTFNSLLCAGYFTRHETNDFSNQFKLTNKFIDYKLYNAIFNAKY